MLFVHQAGLSRGFLVSKDTTKADACHVVCNFAPPTADRPSLLDHREKEARLATSGTFYRRQVALALSDLKLHAARTGDAANDARAILNRTYGDVFVELPAGTHLGAYWGHLTGYDAGYYGYLWSEAIAADMADVFEKAPGRYLDAAVGRRLRDEIYAVGGSREAEESIHRFLRRDRSNEPFLKSVGLK